MLRSTPVRRKVAVLGATSALALAVVAGGGSVSSASTVAKAPPAQVAAGKVVFKANCTACHTLSNAKSHGTAGPNLDKLKPSAKLVIHQVTNGGGGMPAFGGRLSKTKITAVAAYVSTVATGKAGKPTTGGLP